MCANPWSLVSKLHAYPPRMSWRSLKVKVIFQFLSALQKIHTAFKFLYLGQSLSPISCLLTFYTFYNGYPHFTQKFMLLYFSSFEVYNSAVNIKHKPCPPRIRWHHQARAYRTIEVTLWSVSSDLLLNYTDAAYFHFTAVSLFSCHTAWTRPQLHSPTTLSKTNWDKSALL